MSNKTLKSLFNLDSLRWITQIRVTGPHALILIVVGIILVLVPGTVLTTLIRIIGAAAVLSGLYLGYSWNKNRETESRSMLVAAAIALFAGLVMLLFPNLLVSIFPFAASLVVLANGLIHLFEGLELRKNNSPRWLPAVILSGITILVGLYMFFHTVAVGYFLVKLLGIVMIYNGLCGLFITKQMNNK